MYQINTRHPEDKIEEFVKKDGPRPWGPGNWKLIHEATYPVNYNTKKIYTEWHTLLRECNPEEPQGPFNISDQDIKLVVQQTECNAEEAKTMLIKCGGDIVNAIMELS